MDSSLPGSSLHGIFPVKNTGVGCHFLLQGILPAQGWNWVSCITGSSLPLSHRGSPIYVYMYLFFRFFCHLGYCRVLNRVPCAINRSCFLYRKINWYLTEYPQLVYDLLIMRLRLGAVHGETWQYSFLREINFMLVLVLSTKIYIDNYYDLQVSFKRSFVCVSSWTTWISFVGIKWTFWLEQLNMILILLSGFSECAYSLLLNYR